MTAFLKKWWIESDFKAPNLPLSLRLKVPGCHYNSICDQYNMTQTSLTPGLGAPFRTFGNWNGRQIYRCLYVCIFPFDHCIVCLSDNHFGIFKTFLYSNSQSLFDCVVILTIVLAININQLFCNLSSLTQQCFIDVSVPGQENQCSYICALVVSILRLSTIFLLDFGTVPTECHFVCFSLHSIDCRYCHSTDYIAKSCPEILE